MAPWLRADLESLVNIYRGMYDEDLDMCWGEVGSYHFKNLRQAYSAALEIVENDDNFNHDTDEWERVEPPTEWPPSANDRASWPHWFHVDFMVKQAFDSGTPLFVKHENGEDPTIAISLTEKCLGMQVLNPTACPAQKLPFRFGSVSSSLKPYANAAYYADCARYHA